MGVVDINSVPAMCSFRPLMGERTKLWGLFWPGRNWPVPWFRDRLDRSQGFKDMAGQADPDRLIAGAYAAALDGRGWTKLLDWVAESFGAVGASFELVDNARRRPLLLELGTNLQQPIKEDYLEHYGRLSPRVTKLANAAPATISYDYAILSEEEMNADEFYSDFMAPIGLRYFLAGHIGDVNGLTGVFAVQRSPRQGHVESGEIDLMRRILPHIQQSVDLKCRLAKAELQARSLLAGIEDLAEGLVLIDHAGLVFHINSEAQRILSENDGIAILDHQLSCDDRHDNRRLERLLRSVLIEEPTDRMDFNNSMVVQRPSSRPPYLVSVRRLPQEPDWPVFADGIASVVIFIRDPVVFSGLNISMLKQSYGLSNAEAAVAVALDRGLSLGDIARQRGVARSTVRSQLYALMAKLSVTRQANLVRLLGNYRKP